MRLFCGFYSLSSLGTAIRWVQTENFNHFKKSLRYKMLFVPLLVVWNKLSPLYLGKFSFFVHNFFITKMYTGCMKIGFLCSMCLHEFLLGFHYLWVTKFPIFYALYLQDDDIYFVLEHDQALSHLIFAGSDIVLCQSFDDPIYQAPVSVISLFPAIILSSCFLWIFELYRFLSLKLVIRQTQIINQK